MQVRVQLLLLLAALGLLVSGERALAEPCQRYEPDVIVLEGTLQLKAFAGPPHYKSIEFGDQPEAVWILTLLHPICIAALPEDAWNIALEGVQTVEIIPRTNITLALNGKRVQVQGSLSRPRSAHRHAEIALRANLVAPSQP